MAHRFESVSGFVLAGGASSRMGLPKQHLHLGSETMLERQIRLLRKLCREVSVVGLAAESARDDVAFRSDLIPGRGPLGGIHAALAASRTEFNLVVACDLPFLEPRFLRGLVWLAISSGADVTIPEDKSRRFLPVCAVYRRRIQKVVRSRLVQGLNKADGYFRSVRLQRVPWQEIMGAGFPSRIFDNINRPEDFVHVRQRLGL